MKKFRAKIALILVLALTLAVAIPALAAAQTTQITGMYEATTIEVVIPTTGTAILNPFGLPLEITADDGSTSLGKIGTNDQILTRPLVGYNMSDLDLKVSATATAKPKGGFKIGNAAGPDKTGTINLDIMQNTYDIGADIWYYDATALKTKKNQSLDQLNGKAVVNALNGWTGTTPVAIATPNTDNTVYSTADGVEATCDLDAATVTTVNGKTSYKLNTGSLFFTRLTGALAKSPVVSATDNTKVEWAAKDGVEVVVTWTIEPR